MNIDKTRLWLCLPFVVLFLIDGGVTLIGQPAAYWRGDTTCVREAFPLFHWALAISPYAAGLLTLAWIAALSAIIVTLPRLIAEILALTLAIGHTWGAMTWFFYTFPLCLLYLPFSAALFILAYRQWRRRQTDN